MIIEVLSPANTSYERTKKFAIYQEVAVPEYWLVDYQAKTTEVFGLTKGTYHLVGKYELGDTVVSGQLPGFKIAVEMIFNF